MRNFEPQSRQFNERKISREQRAFGAGAFNEIPPSKLPANAVAWLENYIAHDDRLEPRGGSKRWGGDTAVTYQVPRFLTGLTVTKATSVISSAAAFVGVTAGMFIHYDDGGYDLIISVTSTSACIVDSTTAHAASAAAWINEPVYGLAYHNGKNILIIQAGSKLYVANRDLASGGTFSLSAGWNRIYGLSTNLTAAGSDEDLTHGMSDFAEFGDFMVVFNNGPSASYSYFGIYAIRLGTTPIVFYPINGPVPTQRLTNNNLRSETKIYGYRYLYTMSRIRGAGTTGDRTTTGAVIELESGPTQVNASDYKDYGEEWVATPIGPSTAAENYDVWTGNALPAALDTVTELAAKSNAQFKITCSATTYNIACNYTGISSWAEFCSVTQTAMREFLPDMEVSFSSASRVIFKNRFKGGDITSFAAGDAGDDISSMFATGAAVSTVWDAPLTINTASAILKTILDHWTHYSIYRTLDIGTNGIDPITGQGNNKELYVWVADIPIIKPFKCSSAAGTNIVTAAAGTFSADDVGKLITYGGGTTDTIVTYTDSAHVVVDSATDLTDVSASIGNPGGNKRDLASKAGTVVTCTNLNFNSGCVAGDAIFWEDGTVDIYVAWITDTTFSVAASGNLDSQAIARDPTQCSFYDRTADDTLRTRASGFSLKNRFWEPLPNSNTGMIADGFMVCGERGKKDVAYCQIANGYEYLWGYHNPNKQITSYKDVLTRIVFCNDNAIVFLQNSVHRIPLNNYATETIEAVGEVVAVLTGTAPVAPETGCRDFGAILPINNYEIVFVSSENELLLLEYYETPKLGADLSKDRFRKLLRKNIGIAAMYYDKTVGLLLWIKTQSYEERTYSTSGLASEILDKSYRVAVIQEQGVGVSENTGSSFVYPFSGVNGVRIKDSNGRPRALLLDAKDGYMYDFTHREGATDGAVGLLWRDKITNAGTGGTDYTPSVLFGLDEGAAKHYFLEHLESHIYVEPFDRSLADATGYDSAGYPDDMEFRLTVYNDGNTSAVKARAEDALFSGDISFDRYFRAHGVQIKLTANQAEHIVIGRQQYYKSEDQADEPDNRQTTEMTQKELLADVDAWFFPRNGSLLNLSTGSAPSTNPTVTLVESPDGETLGVSLGAQTIEDTNVALSFTGDFSVKLTVGNIDATGTYFYIGAAFSVRVYLNGATYTVAILHNGTTYTHALAWGGTGWLNLVVARYGTNLLTFEGDNV